MSVYPQVQCMLHFDPHRPPTLFANCIFPRILISFTVGAQVFPLPPGQGFPWAHSTRGKPRRGMMRRAVFSGK